MSDVTDAVDPTTKKIADLNDALRTTFTGGTIVMTRGIQALTDGDRAMVLAAVMRFKEFNEDNDPWHLHDMAILTVPGINGVGEHRIMFKVDTYDLKMQFLSPAPEDPLQTRRVLTILLASEY
ncbi:MAG: DUF3768 domain-containing protein [Rhodospirillaceae bacterium]|nr:DUF3768 domain-containing protein [Rhodospirillaceae bacterium]